MVVAEWHGQARDWQLQPRLLGDDSDAVLKRCFGLLNLPQAKLKSKDRDSVILSGVISKYEKHGPEASGLNSSAIFLRIWGEDVSL